MKRFVEWFWSVPDGVWITVMLLDAAAAVYVGYALLKAAGY